jgi:hypothetical protein
MGDQGLHNTCILTYAGLVSKNCAFCAPPEFDFWGEMLHFEKEKGV